MAKDQPPHDSEPKGSGDGSPTERDSYNPFARAFESVEAETWWRTFRNKEFVRKLAEFAAMGMRMRKGSKKPRKDALAVLMEKTFEGLMTATGNAPTADEVLDHLEEYDEQDAFGIGGTIQQIDEGTIYWVNKRGHEQTTSFGSFRNRLTSIRKRHRL